VLRQPTARFVLRARDDGNLQADGVRCRRDDLEAGPGELGRHRIDRRIGNPRRQTPLRAAALAGADDELNQQVLDRVGGWLASLDAQFVVLRLIDLDGHVRGDGLAVQPDRVLETVLGAYREGNAVAIDLFVLHAFDGYLGPCRPGPVEQHHQASERRYAPR